MTPPWFTKAISAPCESRFVDLDGTPVHYLIWNSADTHKPGLLFAHGFRAHARWWSFIAPFFLSRFRVVALDFPGMGDSGARPQYDWLDFSRAIRAVLEHSGLGRSTLIGHSFGGSHVARAAHDFPELVERAVIIDSYIPVLGVQGRRPLMEVRPKNIYPTYAAARARFRLVPEQNIASEYVLDYIAQHSLKECLAGGLGSSTRPSCHDSSPRTSTNWLPCSPAFAAPRRLSTAIKVRSSHASSPTQSSSICSTATAPSPSRTRITTSCSTSRSRWWRG